MQHHHGILLYTSKTTTELINPVLLFPQSHLHSNNTKTYFSRFTVHLSLSLDFTSDERRNSRTRNTQNSNLQTTPKQSWTIQRKQERETLC